MQQVFVYVVGAGDCKDYESSDILCEDPRKVAALA